MRILFVKQLNSGGDYFTQKNIYSGGEPEVV